MRRAGYVLAASIVSAALVRAVIAQTSPKNTVCVSNLKQLSLGTLMYVQDWDLRFPPMKAAPAAKSPISPYIRNASIFLCPESGRPYVGNPALARKPLAKIATPATTWMYRDAKAHADGSRATAYVDGHVKREKRAPR